MFASTPPHHHRSTPASHRTLIRQTPATTQAFLLAVLLSTLFSLCLNVYLSAKLGAFHEMRQDVVQSFTTDNVAEHMAMAAAGRAVPSMGKKSNEQKQQQKQELRGEGHIVAGLQCDKYGGPSPDLAQEMVYWEDIPDDNKFISPFKQEHMTQYLTFEPDGGGWNNIRMNMETVLALAFAMGRTLVLPPAKHFYLLDKTTAEHGGEQKKTFSFSNFFHMESIHDEHVGLDIISMTEYLENVAMKGKLKSRHLGGPIFPPGNRTNWDGATEKELKALYAYLRDGSHSAVWVPEECMAAFPASRHTSDEKALEAMVEEINNMAKKPTWEDYVGKPVPVDAPTIDRLKENWADRKKLCIYNNVLQQQDAIHMPTDEKLNARLLVHFYAMLFFQDWKTDLWMKRFIRDHVRYLDEIQCAAARVVNAVRERVRKRQPHYSNGDFDTFHVRRGDFQYKVTRSTAEQIYEISKQKLTPGDTVYIATDERDKSFFDPLKQHYDVVFLDDFMDALGKETNTNYYGMIDQLVASRGRVFFGCWFSTFTAYINRLRGYHADNNQEPGYEQGIINSWYYALEDRYDHHQRFYPVKQAFYAREFPTSWRLIDYDVDAK